MTKIQILFSETLCPVKEMTMKIRKCTKVRQLLPEVYVKSCSIDTDIVVLLYGNISTL